jgi:hypothetical protein
LRRQGCLLVLDDVLNRDAEKWDALRTLFGLCGVASAMVVTTRDMEVALTMGTSVTFHLEQLSPEDSWTLFSRRAFSAGLHESLELVSTGKKIVSKCHGVPLAVKSMGALMSTKQEIRDWMNILESSTWSEEAKILPTLMMSYNHLPSYMKQWFAFCDVFPKDYEIDKLDLVHHWIASGFIPSEMASEPEATGNAIFSQLVQRSFFHDVQTSGSSTRVLVNGEPGDIIYYQRGLRQGNPLSPMLFILVMDMLNSLISKASERGLLQPILRRGNGQRLSLYANDVVMFVQPHRNELLLIKEILRIFGAASGLVTNIQKSSITPIRCQEQDLEVVQDSLPCSMVNFPCKYLGLPLSVRKLLKSKFLLLIEKIADYLPGWKATLMHPAGRVALIRAVLTAVPIHHFIAVQCPKWVHKAIDKIIRAFLWKGHKDVKGGHCLVGW